MQKKWENTVIFVSGLMSFSFFFYAMALILFVFKMKVKYIVIIFILILSLFAYTYPIIKENSILNVVLLERLSKDSPGLNRTNSLFDEAYDNLINSNNIFWGKGTDETSKIIGGASTYKSMIYSYGIFVFALFVLFFLVTAIYKLNSIKSTILYTILLLGMIYQRPGILDVFYFFLLVSLIPIMNTNTKYSVCN